MPASGKSHGGGIGALSLPYTRAMADEITHYLYATACGPLILEGSPVGLRRAVFGEGPLSGRFAPSTLTNAAASQFQEYLAGKRTAFDIPLDPLGTSFQREVWAAADAVPYGSAVTASQLAASMGRAGSHRSVGMALRQCQLAPFMAVHRVAAGDGIGFQAQLFQGFRRIEQRASSVS